MNTGIPIKYRHKKPAMFANVPEGIDVRQYRYMVLKRDAKDSLKFVRSMVPTTLDSQPNTAM
jgi:hypothetical protein